MAEATNSAAVANNDEQTPIIFLDDIHVVFKTRTGSLLHPNKVHAVNGLSLKLMPGQTIGIVGESGCGKSTTANVMCGLQTPTSGHVYFKGTDVTKRSAAQRKIIGRVISVVFQDPATALNARMTVREQLMDPMIVHKVGDAKSREARVRELIEMVGLPNSVLEALPGQMSHDVRVSVAHTCTGYDDACAAFDAGARHMTHLFNAMPALHHREPGPIAAGAERNDVTAEIIADGVHIHPAMVRLAFALFGDDRMILISDSLRACGLGDGEYELGGQQFFVKGNRATIANGSLAGSVSDVMACMRTAVRTMGIPLTSAVKAATVNPARALGLDGKLGAIAPGYQADAVVLDRDLNIKHVVLRGKVIA